MWLDRPLARRPPLWWELPLGLIVFLTCTNLADIAIGDKRRAALDHAGQVVRLEQAVGLDIEPTLNRWLAANDGWIALANYTYAADYIVTSLALLVFLYLRRPPVYRWARNSLIVLNLIAAACFALYPVAPPRLTPNLGIVDTVMRYHTWGSWGSSVSEGTNQLGALPSLHFALAVWVAIMLFVAGVPMIVRGLGVANIALTLLVIVSTGNHYLLDVLAAVILVAFSVLVTTPRWRSGDHVYAAPLRRSVPHVAGVVMLAVADAEAAALAVRREIARAGPRWRQLLHRTSWRHAPRWVAAGEPDWSWHIGRLEPISSWDEGAGVRRMAVRMAGEPLPEDRPRWRAWVVPTADDPRVAVIIVVDRALDWRGWLDALLRSTAILDDGFRLLGALLDRLRGRRTPRERPDEVVP